MVFLIIKKSLLLFVIISLMIDIEICFLTDIFFPFFKSTFGWAIEQLCRKVERLNFNALY